MGDKMPESVTITPEMTLREAFSIWLGSKRPFIEKLTYRNYGENGSALLAALGDLLLENIDGNHVRAYQVQRSLSVGAAAINHETSLLQQILKRIGRWNVISEGYQPVPRPRESRGRALTEQEEYRLISIGKLNPNWECAYFATVLSAHTAIGPGEMLNLRLCDVFLGNGDPKLAWIKIHEKVKNSFPIRSIPLDREALEAAQKLVERAHRIGATLPEHYLFPFRPKRNTYDPTRHETSFKGGWREILAAVDIRNFRMYDLRHHALTRLAEIAPEHVVLKIAGHSSPKVLRKVYSHVRDNAVHEAI